jgi:hypothetical protein
MGLDGGWWAETVRDPLHLGNDVDPDDDVPQYLDPKWITTVVEYNHD